MYWYGTYRDVLTYYVSVCLGALTVFQKSSKMAPKNLKNEKKLDYDFKVKNKHKFNIILTKLI